MHSSLALLFTVIALSLPSILHAQSTATTSWFCAATASIYVCGFANACSYQIAFGNGWNANQFLAQQQAKTACETNARIKGATTPVCVVACSIADTADHNGGDINPTMPSTPTATPTAAPQLLRCREGTTYPAANGSIGATHEQWSVESCQEGQQFCVTYFVSSICLAVACFQRIPDAYT